MGATLERASFAIQRTRSLPLEMDLWPRFRLFLAILSIASAAKPLYRARPECGAIRDEKVLTNQPYPWVVAILDRDSNLIAVGSLILADLVLTSARVISSRSAEDLTVRAASGQHISVQRIDVHPEFVTNNRSNLALLRLSGEGLALGPETDTMCLFTSFVPKDCVGYNVNEVNDGGIRVEKFDLPLLGSDQCLEQLRTIQLWDSKPFPADSLCTVASTNSSRCRDLASDRGTGLFCPVPEKSGRPLGSSQRYVQVGISSWGRGCNDEPGMYTSVPFFSPWLQKAVTDRISA